GASATRRSSSLSSRAASRSAEGAGRRTAWTRYSPLSTRRRTGAGRAAAGRRSTGGSAGGASLRSITAGSSGSAPGERSSPSPASPSARAASTSPTTSSAGRGRPRRSQARAAKKSPGAGAGSSPAQMAGSSRARVAPSPARCALRPGAPAVLLRAHHQRPAVGDRALQLGDQALVHGSSYNRARPLLSGSANARRPAARPAHHHPRGPRGRHRAREEDDGALRRVREGVSAPGRGAELLVQHGAPRGRALRRARAGRGHPRVRPASRGEDAYLVRSEHRDPPALAPLRLPARSARRCAPRARLRDGDRPRGLGAGGRGGRHDEGGEEPRVARAGDPAPHPRPRRPLLHDRALYAERGAARARRRAGRAAGGRPRAPARGPPGGRRVMSGPIVTVPQYLAAVRTMHGVGVPEMARVLHVTPSVVRRWLHGTLVPTWRRLKGMTALWGGDAELLALGAALQRYCRATGVALEDAV